MKRVFLGLGFLAGLFALALVAATLTVNLASRGKEVSLPDLRGVEIVQAIETLETLGLNLKINGKEYSDTLPLGTIISQQPPAGGMIRKGRSVEAIISVGPRRVAVPELRGAFALQAQSILLENGLKIGRVSKVPSRQWPKDTVVGQSPDPPAMLEKSRPVDLLLSTGPPAALYVMPDLIGRPLADVLKLVQAAGLEISRVAYEEYPGPAPGTVIGQKPPLGTPVSQADALDLTVTRGRSTLPSRKVRYALLSFYVPEGFRSRRVKVVVESERGSREALDETRPAGDRVQVLVEVEGRTKALIYFDDRLQDTRYY